MLRNFRSGDEQILFSLVNSVFRNLEFLRMERVKRLTSSSSFSPKGFFIVERDGLPLGCVSVFNLPAEGYMEIRYLAVKDAFSNLGVVDELIEAAINYSMSRRPRMLKAVSLSIQPYVEAYERFGFKPVRRILRIVWIQQKTFKDTLYRKHS